ncbi:hypothetical protein [Salinibacter altiplanensis]|uniref:hypothetical protein n=1 Tax=Salinibacter altiplanensis TaxID=1803181 RepID=UPI000C9F7A80|nr:hypothetical protein [Salinibacter altiplanensis]
MTQFEYLIILVSILVGLGLADLAKSMRNLLLPEMSVQWHWLPVTWTVIVLGYVLMAWWVFYILLQAEVWHHPVAFLPVLLSTMALYLLCAFALPDADREEVSYHTVDAEGEKLIDMETFYLSEDHRRWFFGMAATFSFLFFGSANYGQFHAGNIPVEAALLQMLSASLLITIPHVILGVTRRRWAHLGLTIYSLGSVTYGLFDVAVALTEVS